MLFNSERVKTSSYSFYRPHSLKVFMASNLLYIVQTLHLEEVLTTTQESRSAQGTGASNRIPDEDLDHITKFLTKNESPKRRELEAFLNGIFLTSALGLRISLAICGGTL